MKKKIPDHYIEVLRSYEEGFEKLKQSHIKEPLVFPFLFVKQLTNMGDDEIVRAWKKYSKDSYP